MHRVCCLALTLWLLLFLIGLNCTHAQEVPEEPPAVISEIERSFVDLTERIKPFVVNIRAKSTSEQRQIDIRDFNELFRFFGMPFPEGGQAPMVPKRVQTALGSGFIYDKSGHIITNNHMVENATDVTVTLSNGTEYPATVVGRDPDTDLAVVKIEPKQDLPVAPLGDSSTLKVGQYAIACGSPQGLQGTFTFGHVSALRRNELDLPGLRFENFIQTDAPINVGNSGGPLCDAHGRVIGINVAIVYGANALGFAIPINTATSVVPALISQGKVVRGFLGIGVRDARPYAEALDLPDSEGAFVLSVQDGGPADDAGLRPYDVVLRVNDTKIEDASDLVSTISQFSPGTEVELSIWRDNETISKTVQLAEYTNNTGTNGGKPEAQSGTASESLGIRVAPLTNELRQQLQLDQSVEGSLIIDMDPGSPAADAGLMPGDVITEIAKQPVDNPDTLNKLLDKHAEPGHGLLVGIVRGGQQEIVVVDIPNKD